MSGLDLRSVARTLGGDVVGGQVLFPPPGHSPQDRSASIRFDPAAPGGFLIHSFAGDDPLPIRDYVKERLGLASDRDVRIAPLCAAPASRTDDAERRPSALAIWREARNPRGTPVELYLNRRGLALPDEAVGEAIRFHPSCPFAGKRTPAMVCLVRNVVTNEPTAIHRTALSLDGRKAHVGGHDRLSLGPVGGGAIKLTPDADVGTCLGIGEGLESTLSLRHAQEFGPSPVWSLLSAGGVSDFPVLPGIECLWLAVDHDPAGLRAATSCSKRWRDAGSEVFLVQPRAEHCDLNDILTEEQRYA